MSVADVEKIYTSAYHLDYFPKKGEPVRDFIDGVISSIKDLSSDPSLGLHSESSLDFFAKGTINITYPIDPTGCFFIQERNLSVSVFNIIAAWCTPEVLSLLLDRGADLFYARKAFEGVRNNYRTPIQSLVYADNFPSLALLQERGIRFSEITSEEMNLMYFARSPEMVKILLSYGVNIDGLSDGVTFNTSDSPLALALRYQNYAVANILIDCGANVKIRISCRSPLSFVLGVLHFSPEEAMTLIEKLTRGGADIDDHSIKVLFEDVYTIRGEAFCLEVLKLFLASGRHPSLLSVKCFKRVLLTGNFKQFFLIYAFKTQGGEISCRFNVHNSSSRDSCRISLWYTLLKTAARFARDQRNYCLVNFLASIAGGYHILAYDLGVISSQMKIRRVPVSVIVWTKFLSAIDRQITLFDMLSARVELADAYDSIFVKQREKDSKS